MSSSHEISHSTDEIRAKKRRAIGLSSQRPTARSDVQRPPASGSPATRMRWLPLVAFVALMVATLLLTANQLFNESIAWPQVGDNLIRGLGGDELMTATGDHASARSEEQVASGEDGLRLFVTDEFDPPGIPLAESAVAERWQLGFVREAGLYRITAWPNYAAWAPLDMQSIGSYRAEATMTIAANSPTGYGGFLGRYQDDATFYLWAVDGQGRAQVLLQQEGVWTTLQPWLLMPTLNQAGVENFLVLEDNGKTLRFWGNHVLLFELTESALPAGNVGLAGGSLGEEIAQIDFGRLTIYTNE